MTDRETELLARWERERPMYAAWGQLVCDRLTSAVAEEIRPARVELFFRMPIVARTKEGSSLLTKAFHRGKAYKQPYEEIEDKVGLRIVVLVSDEIRIVERAICNSPHWTAAKARDFEEERSLRPFQFDYQSLHYVVRNAIALRQGDVEITPGTPCEVQVRTLLQHAHSELTHDTIYKPSVTADPDVKRAAAKSMALIEATDDYFLQVRQRLAAAQAPGHQVATVVEAAYPTFAGLPADLSPLNALMIDYFKRWAPENFEAELQGFLAEKGFLADRIRERAETNIVFRQPAVLLAYFAIKRMPRSVSEDGPLSEKELAPLYSDLGLRPPSAAM